jgi:hypothetical protein
MGELEDWEEKTFGNLKPTKTNPIAREQAMRDEFNKKEMEDSMTLTHGKETAIALRPLSSIARLSQEQAMTILDTIWPDAPRIEKLKAAMLCHDYKLNPLKKHVALIKFKNTKNNDYDWVVVTSIDVDRLAASRRGRYAYIDNTPRIMTNREQETIFGKVDVALTWAICKLKDTKGGEVVGYGNWQKGKDPYGTDKGNTALNMAFIRAERQALRKLFPSEMPSDIEGVETMDSEYIPDDAKEVIEGEVRDISDAKELPPSDAKLGKETPLPSEDKGIPSEEIGEPYPKFTAKYGDLLSGCTIHGDAWSISKFKKRTHKTEDGWCNFADLLKPITEDICKAAGIEDGLALNEQVKAKYEGRTWSKLSEAEQLSVLEGLL